jgi:hypothetical protein
MHLKNLMYPTTSSSSSPSCEGCGDSNQAVKHSDVWVLMQVAVICSIWEGTWCGLSIIETSGKLRSVSGAGQLPEI